VCPHDEHLQRVISLMFVIMQKVRLHTANAVFTETHSCGRMRKESGSDGMESSVERSLEGCQAKLSGATNPYMPMSAVMRAHASNRRTYSGAHYPSPLKDVIKKYITQRSTSGSFRGQSRYRICTVATRAHHMVPLPQEWND